MSEEKMVTKNIIILGKTGTGKSTIMNMLINDGFMPDNCDGPAKVGNDANPVTTAQSFYYNLKKKDKMFIDTIGFSDPKYTESELISICKDFFKACKIGVNTIIVTFRMTRMTKEDWLNMESIDKIFTKDWHNNAILVFTNFDRSFQNADDELNKWIKTDPKLPEFIGKFRKIIFTDNNTSCEDQEVRTRPIRKKCLNDLSDFIDSNLKFIQVRQTNIIDYVIHIIRLYLSTLRGFPNVNKEIISYLTKNSETAYVGTCDICLENIKFLEIGLLDCEHIFHLDRCLIPWSKKSNECPVCRAAFTKMHKADLNN
jgi:GTP-binding protein EngB required for normal cell division